LRKPGTAKIQKIQLMKQYFKDYKSKMLKEELTQQSSVNFQPGALSDTSKGIFVKKKVLTESMQEESSSNVFSGFLFNFKDPSINDVNLSAKVNSLKLS
jgi:Domain of unknown function (DUF4615)